MPFRTSSIFCKKSAELLGYLSQAVFGLHSSLSLTVTPTVLIPTAKNIPEAINATILTHTVPHISRSKSYVKSKRRPKFHSGIDRGCGCQRRSMLL
ncbi:hypothetical protein X798_07724 [Onchocerca flexuosa]|uniref:Secreted protein n=2 Tax=Onchocerca flexuosa TaxID=387005 RepID=A0A183I2N0_9BILA|nr:hypothetical protein X798_07724 [Onchocerca flexuosa]VDP15200.1 unnamed protein product [Onchocerca flexuosa]